MKSNDRMLEALEFRKSGMGYIEIADKLGYASHTGALQAVERALKKTLQEPSDELRNLEVARLDALLVSQWEPAMRGIPKAVETVLKIMERRAKLLGLDSPATLNVNLIQRRVQEIADKLGVPVGDVLAQAVQVANDALAGVEL